MRRPFRSCVPILLILALAGAASADPLELADAFLPREARLGIEVQPMTPELREFMDAPRDEGVLVVRVGESAPAAEAGLAVGDVIVAAGERRIVRPIDLVREVDEVPEGGTLSLAILREGEAQRIEIAPSGRRSPWANPERWSEHFESWMDRGFERGRERLRDRLEELEERLDELERRLETGEGEARPT